MDIHSVSHFHMAGRAILGELLAIFRINVLKIKQEVLIKVILIKTASERGTEGKCEMGQNAHACI